MSCGSGNNSVNKTFIIEPLQLTGGSPTLSACTTMYTNLVESCSGDTSIQLGTGYITISGDTFVGGNFTASTIEATTYLSGGTNILDIVNGNDTFVTGGTFSNFTDSISLTRNDGVDVIITGLTDFYTTGATLIEDVVYFDRNDSLSAYTLDLSTLVVTDTYLTGATYDKDSGVLELTRNDNDSIFVSGITDFYVSGGSYNTLTQNIEFSGNSSASTFNVDVSALLDDTNTFITGFTYDNSNNLTIVRNDGTGFTTNISVMTGLTVNGDVTVTGITDLNILSADTTYFGTIETVDYIQFNTGYTGNTILEGRIYWDEDNGTLSLGMHGGNVHQQIGQELFYYIKNQSGATIENGRVVKAAGTLGASGRILGEYMIGDGSVPAKFTLGVATEDIPNGEDGYVTEFGLVRGIDTTGGPYGETWNDGDVLWVSPTVNGGLTNIHPIAPNLHVEMAIVIDSAVNGSIFVRPHRYPNFHDLQEAGWSGGTENDLDVIQWNGATGLFELTNTPLFNSLSAVTISADTYYGDGSNLTGINADNDFTTASTLFNNVVYFDRTDALSAYTLDLTGFVTNDTYLTGGTFTKSASTLTLTRNDDFDVVISGISDEYTTGATFLGNTIWFDRTDSLSAYSVTLSGVTASTDYYTTGVTLDGTTLIFDRNDTLSAYTVDLADIIGSGTSSSDTVKFTGSRNRQNQNNIFLRQSDGTPFNIIPYRVYQDATITNVVASGRDLDTWDAHILTGTTVVSDSIYLLHLAGEDSKYDDSVGLDVSSGDTLYLYMSGTSVSYPTIDVYLKKR